MDSQSNLQHFTEIKDFFHRTMMHFAFWYSETEKQFGREIAFEVLDNAWNRFFEIFMTRIGKISGFDTKDGMPLVFKNFSAEQSEQLKNALAVNWLANDGVWFQSIEFIHGMENAKKVNDNTWAQFSPFEARTIKKKLGLSEFPGLEGLKIALQHRLYAFVNIQEIIDESEKSFVFRMVECRVQHARKRKGLDDYPCKSGGIVEYTTFAETIDPAIKTSVISCPPDPHPDSYFCAWRFYIE
ncbi:MAG: cytosolic protein [Saprospiraceae bacterium]|nr:cytosolic protein [Saprospiraceae bacterium]